VNADDILRLLKVATDLGQTLSPLIRQALVTLPASDQAQILSEAKRLAEINDALHRQVTDRLRG
jgi:hypothetical protein